MKKPENYLRATEILKEIGNFRINPSLENFEKFLKESGIKPNFQLIQVSGTNGKTSTSVFLASLISKSGKKTGLYISPHVFQFGERIAIDGNSLSMSEFGESFLEFYRIFLKLIKKHKLTQFEILTAFSVWLFNSRGIEFAVYETGLGGRFDAVSALNAEVGLLTGVHFDHMEYLGNTIESISYEKLYPFRKKRVFVLDSALNDDILKVAKGLDVKIQIINTSNLSYRLTSEGTVITAPFQSVLRLTGSKYAENALLSYHTLRSLGFDVSEKDLETAFVPARFQKLVIDDSLIVFDGSHNPQAIRVFLDTFTNIYEGREFSVVCGFMKDKDFESMLNLIIDSSPKIVVLTTIKSAIDRSANLYGHARGILKYEQKLETAIDIALSYTNLMALTGSLYLCGEFIEAFIPKLGYDAFNYKNDGILRYF
ncbi:MAG: Mur ligase family protein [Actinobacteria bacterium]|nr:Mur ligase family protein [Actinomycetota bacterium]